MKNIPIIIDGPNYINRIIDLKIDPLIIARQLSGESLKFIINEKIKDIPSFLGMSSSVEFVCSNKQFGYNNDKFTKEQQLLMLNRLRMETGVFVDIVTIPGSTEKGVDMTISGKIEDYSKDYDAVVLVSADKDFIPTIQKLRHKVKVFLVSLQENYPVELQNEAFSTLNLHKDYLSLFKYHYPRYHIDKLTEGNCVELFSEADDRIYNQIRATNDGYVYISKKVGNLDLLNIKFRFETFVALNDYVGPQAASDKKYIKEQFEKIKDAWYGKESANLYIL